MSDDWCETFLYRVLMASCQQEAVNTILYSIDNFELWAFQILDPERQ